MAKNAIVVVAASEKGGVGKSEIIANLGAYLALKHKHVLFIDTDYQYNLTSCMNNVDKTDLHNSEIIRAYKHDADNVSSPFPKNFKPAKVNKYVDLLASCRQIDDISNIMRNQPTIAPYVILHIFNTMKLQQKYDYILIDTHNSFNLLTQGAMVVADYILTPVIPGRFSISSIGTMIESLRDLKANLVNPATQQPFVTGKQYFVGNMVDFNTKSSHQFTNIIKKNPDFIASFHRRELVNRATTNFSSVFAQAYREAEHGRKNSQKIIDDEIRPNFDKIIKKIDK